MGSEWISPFFMHFSFFTHFFAFFLRFSSLFSSSPKGQGQTTAIYCKNGEFHSDPVCTDPVQNFPRAFFLAQNKIGGKNPQQNSNQNLGASRPKSTLQGSAESLGPYWEVLNGVGVDGVGGIFPFSSFFFAFFVFFRFSSFFFAFLRFSSFFSYSPGTRADDCNLLGKWGISLRPRLHRPRSELPDLRVVGRCRQRKKFLALWGLLPARAAKTSVLWKIFGSIGSFRSCAVFRAGKKPINRKTHKQNFHGIVPGLSRDCPGLFPRLPGNFVYVFPFFPRKKGNT